MLKRSYDPKIALGSIMAGGTLGILIPPSILAIIFAVVAQESVGELYVGSILPGLLLSGMYILYVWIRTLVNPSLGPVIPVQERVSLKEKIFTFTTNDSPDNLNRIGIGGDFHWRRDPSRSGGDWKFWSDDRRRSP